MNLKKAVAVVALLALCGALVVEAVQSVTLAWDASASSNVTSYNIYYGPATHAYTNRTPVGNVTNATLNGFLEGSIYFFAATAQDAGGLESEFSNEVSYLVPTNSIGIPPPPGLWVAQ